MTFSNFKKYFTEPGSFSYPSPLSLPLSIVISEDFEVDFDDFGFLFSS